MLQLVKLFGSIDIKIIRINIKLGMTMNMYDHLGRYSIPYMHLKKIIPESMLEWIITLVFVSFPVVYLNAYTRYPHFN